MLAVVALSRVKASGTFRVWVCLQAGQICFGHVLVFWGLCMARFSPRSATPDIFLENMLRGKPQQIPIQHQHHKFEPFPAFFPPPVPKQTTGFHFCSLVFTSRGLSFTERRFTRAAFRSFNDLSWIFSGCLCIFGHRMRMILFFPPSILLGVLSDDNVTTAPPPMLPSNSQMALLGHRCELIAVLSEAHTEKRSSKECLSVSNHKTLLDVT